MKLTVVRVKGNIERYMLAINKSEATAAGLVDDDGVPIEVDKIVDAKGNKLIVQKSDGSTGRAVSSRFIYKHLDELRSGKSMRTSRNDHYTMRGNILYKQKHQEYLRGEDPLPYAEMIGEVFYDITRK